MRHCPVAADEASMDLEFLSCPWVEVLVEITRGVGERREDQDLAVRSPVAVGGG